MPLDDDPDSELLRARRAAAQPTAAPAGPVAPAPGHSAPSDRLPVTYGRRAVGPDGRPRPGVAEVTREGGSWGGRAGILDLARPDSPATGGLLTAGGGFGDRTNARGERVQGAEVSGAAVRVGYEDLARTGFGFDAGVGTFQAGVTRTDSTTQLGAQANLAEGSVTVGTPEHNARFGLSSGLGAAVRAHYGDSDGDGIPEAGFGGDLGIFSFDLRSELLGRMPQAAAENRARIDEGIARRAAQQPPEDPDTILPVMPRLGLRPRR